MDNVLNVENLSMRFDSNELFKNLNFSLKPGSMTALLGANGTGKTTLINILMGLLLPSSGHFNFKKNIRLGYVPQFRNIDTEYPLSIESFVSLNAPLIKTRKVRERIKNELKETDLFDIKNIRMGEASGGQKQRAYLAQTLLDQPNMIILDEATASLDPVAKEELMTLLNHLNEEHNITVLFVTHDVTLARKYMTEYLYLNHGGIEHGRMNKFAGVYE